ncbi:NAD(P)-dependent oxidoreductase [Actinomadura parmotrematis]|uniref:3-phosphoglycerate dehydrogenase n=1 Tax=Actinomadura parmotrematis TaxID=2864039 RepID=A0ABS7FQ72_9ACTN|nr:NAD(P)-dependent oxidoreductase [Actinomadura parmotrematis]MBW8481707.1 3-phosphoglycerate dehydrogenase [Actinomadura parmotrematis]
MTRTWKALALPPLDPGFARSQFEPLGDVEVVFLESRDRAGLLAGIADADLVVADFTGRLALDAEAVAAAPRLAFVQTPGVGTDSVDTEALAAAGVPVANTAGSNARAVAEWAVGAAFALCRRTVSSDRAMRAGAWPQQEVLRGGTREIHSLRVGIVGYGAIGAETARLFAALGSTVSYWSRRRRAEAVATYRELDDLLAGSDLLVIALPLAPGTRGLLGADRLALLPQGALLVNVARGGIAPDADVRAALDSGRLAGAALDVYETEPLPEDHPLRSDERVLLSPHTAGGTRESQLTMLGMMKDNLAAAMAGRPVANVVNGVDPVVRQR